MALLYHPIGNDLEALSLQQRALAISEAVFGPEHMDTALSLNNLGQIHWALGDLETSLPLVRRSLMIRERLLAHRVLSGLFLATNQLERALKVERRAVESSEGILSLVLSFTSERQRLAYQRSLEPYNVLATLSGRKSVGAESVRLLARTVLRQKGLVLDSLLEDRRVVADSSKPSHQEWVK